MSKTYNNHINSIINTIPTPSALRKQIEEEQMRFANVLGAIVKEVNYYVRFAMENGRNEAHYELVHTMEDGEYIRENHRIVNILMDIYKERGYEVKCIIAHDGYAHAKYFQLTFKF